MIDCEALDNLDLDFWDVMPKSIRVNCSVEPITFPLTVYGVERGAMAYRVLNPTIASVNQAGEVTLGQVRGVTMILAWRNGDLCDIRYIQVDVECPCDEYLPGGSYPYDGGGGLSWDPVEGCDGAASFTLLVSGFTGACTGLNGAYVLRRAAPYVWLDASGTVQVRSYADRWRVEVGIGTASLAEDYPAYLSCAGDHPAGSGTLVSQGCGQTGLYTIS